MSGDSVHNNNGLIGADVRQIATASGPSFSNISGSLIFSGGPAGTIAPREILTLVDGTPGLTFATPGNVRAASAMDNFIGTDTPNTTAPGAQTQTYGSPIGHNFYVADASADGNWAFQIKSAGVTSKVPAVMDSNLSVLGTCLIGCGPLIPGATQFSDNFARDSLGSDWTAADGTCSITSKQAGFTLGSDHYALCVYSAFEPGTNQYAQANINSLSGSGYIGVGVRMSRTVGVETGYIGLVSGGGSAIVKLLGGSSTYVAGSNFSGPTFAANDNVRLEADGPTLKLYKNGAVVLTGTDRSIRVGFTGYAGSTFAGRLLNNFRGGDLAFASSSLMIDPVGVFSTLSTCNGTLEGAKAAVTDSTTNTWGATISGGGSFHVGAYCDGTNWTVYAK